MTGSVHVGDKPFRGQVVFYKDDKWLDSTMSDEAGKFTAMVSPGSYRLQAQGLFAAESLLVVAGGETDRKFHVTAVELRFRVEGPDGKPRAGVVLIVGSTTSVSSWHLPPSGKDGRTVGSTSPGRYDIKVMPKRLTEQKALREFYMENQNDPEAMTRVQVQLAQIDAQVGSGELIVVKLPASAGY